MSDAVFAAYLLAKERGEPLFPRADVYRRLVRGAFRSVIEGMFPKTCEALGEAEVGVLLGEFLEAGGPNTPFYRDIAGDLVAWAGSVEHPLADLLQWEWLDRVAARHLADLDLFVAPPDVLTPNPTMQLAVFSRPVEQITRDLRAPEPFESPMAYAVWRRPRTDQIETHRMGLLLARGLALAATAPKSLEAIADQLSAETPALARETIAASLRQLEVELRAREGIL